MENIGSVINLLFSAVLLVCLVILYRNNKKTEMQLQSERYVYPKKDAEITPKKQCNTDCTCDCLGEQKLVYNGDFSDVHLDNSIEECTSVDMDEFARVLKRQKHRNKFDDVYVNIPAMYTKDNNTIYTSVMCLHYMNRGNKCYFRGKNVKVILTEEN